MNLNGSTQIWRSSREAGKALLAVGLKKGELKDVARDIRRRAGREKWETRKERGNGGEHVAINFVKAPEDWLRAIEQFETLPAAVANSACLETPPVSGPAAGAESATHAAVAGIPIIRAETYRAMFEHRSDSVKKQAYEDAVILGETADLIEQGYPKTREKKEIAKKHGISRSTLQSWFTAVAGIDRADWAPMLADQREGHLRTQSYSSRIDDLIRADYLREERPSFMSCYRRVEKIAAVEGLKLPAAATLKRHLEQNITPQAIRLARHGRKAFEATYPAQERDRSGFRALQAVCADGHVLAGC